MLNFSLNMSWDDGNQVWTVTAMDFADPSGSPTLAVHSVNEAMSQILKIFQALDIQVKASAIKILPGTPAVE